MAAVIILVIAGLVGFKFLSKGKKIDNPYVMYVKDQELSIFNRTNAKPMEVTSKLVNASENINASEFYALMDYVHYSEDYKYIFYPDKVSESGWSFFWRDLKSGKADEANKIDSGEIYNTAINKNGSKFFYIKGDDSKLYVYDRKSDEKNKLDENVESFFVNDEGNYIIYRTNRDDNYTIYEMHLDGLKGEKTMIESDAIFVNAYPNSKKVFYLKDGYLYLKESNKDAEEISSNVTYVVSVVDEKSVYYLKGQEVTQTLNMFIDDDLAASDKNLKEPETPSYPEEPEEPDEDLYTTKVWHTDYFWGYVYNEELNEWGYWDNETDWDIYNELNAKYEEEYEKWEAEYDRLTDEYNQAYSLYEEKLSRDRLRNELLNEENAVTYDKYQLYYWNGDEALVANDIVLENPYYDYLIAYSYEQPVLVYQKYNESNAAQLKMSELFSGEYTYVNVDMIHNLAYSSRAISDDIFVSYEDKEYPITTEDSLRWSIGKDGMVYFMDNYDNDESIGTLKSIKLSSEKIGAPVTIDEDVAGYSFYNGSDKVYYYKDINDFYELYQDGKLLATDVLYGSAYSVKNSSKLYYLADYDTDNDNGTLCCLNGNEEIKISDEVYTFVPVSENEVVYLKDYNTSTEEGDLVLYQGNKKQVTVDTNVAAIFDFSNISLRDAD